MDIQTTLNQAIEAAKAGRKAEARQLLEAVLDADQRNEQAWLWLSGVVDDDEERTICLENVLTINPHNEVARKGLAALGAVPATDQLASPDVLEGEPGGPSIPEVLEPATETELVDEEVASGLALPDRRAFILLTIVLALMLICTVVSILTFVVLAPVG